MNRESSRTVSVRLDADLLARLTAAAVRRAAETGRVTTLSDVLRAIIGRLPGAK